MKEQSSTSVDPDEIERFSRIAGEWWNSAGKFKPLHRINPLRIGFIRDQAVRHFNVASDKWQVASQESPVTCHLPLQGLAVLDIGCGGGLVCEPMCRLGAKVTGIDASEKNIKVARLHAQQSELDIDYRATSAEALLETGARFDIVLALEIIEHVADIAAFVTASCGLLKPGGIMIWSSINRTAKSYALAIIGAEYVLRWVPRGTHSWKKFVTPAELCAQLRCNAIEVVEMTGMTMNPLTFKWQLDPQDISVNYLLVGKKPAAKSEIPCHATRKEA